MGRRRKAREIALQVLFEIDALEIDAKAAIDLFWNNFEAPDDVKDFSSKLVNGTRDHVGEIDSLIVSCSENWSIQRMSRVDRNILRLAVYELLYCSDIPPKVALNEAIDLGKSYGSENSGSFINGILDALHSKLKKEDGPTQDRNGEAGQS
ncbi:MAG: transcription antitermination factor NusB [Syntrophales bacterium]|jgi:N utilization substance protein B|nr:transcription antitermination factor NusB [Syntrophales bacterium]MDD5532674.1 transcription antitermination factor NusB [Syntrophales bacterium]HPL63843.1 transcription antitermination factor NusB [Syntrophales bacterium]